MIGERSRLERGRGSHDDVRILSSTVRRDFKMDLVFFLLLPGLNLTHYVYYLMILYLWGGCPAPRCFCPERNFEVRTMCVQSWHVGFNSLATSFVTPLAACMMCFIFS
jgi:hypothetical protein